MPVALELTGRMCTFEFFSHEQVWPLSLFSVQPRTSFYETADPGWDLFCPWASASGKGSGTETVTPLLSGTWSHGSWGPLLQPQGWEQVRQYHMTRWGGALHVQNSSGSHALQLRGQDGNAQHRGLVAELREGNLGCREKVHTGHRMFVNRGWNSAGQSG